MSKIIADFKALPLDAQTEAFPQLTSIFNANANPGHNESAVAADSHSVWE